MRDLIEEEAKSLRLSHFKLTDGQEILAIVARDVKNEPAILVEEPLALHNEVIGDTYTVSFREYMPLNNSRIATILRHNIVSFCDVNLSGRTRYLEALINLAEPPDAFDGYEYEQEDPEGYIEPEEKIIH